MLWRPNTQYISSRHVQYINRSQLLITDLQPAGDDTRRRLCSAMLMNPSASSPLAFHPSLPACHLTPFPVIAPRPSLLPPSSFIFPSQFLPAALSLRHFHPSFLPSYPAPRESGHNGGIQLLLWACLHARDSFKRVGSNVRAHSVPYNMRGTKREDVGECCLLHIHVLIDP